VLTANSSEKLDELDEVLGAEVSLSFRQSDEGLQRCQVRPCSGNRSYGAVGTLIPDPVAMPARSLGDSFELLST
jgi:hypothetical protein